MFNVLKFVSVKFKGFLEDHIPYLYAGYRTRTFSRKIKRQSNIVWQILASCNCNLQLLGIRISFSAGI